MTVLFVLLTIMLFLGIDWIVRSIRHRKPVPIAPVALPGPARPLAVRLPEGIFFAKSHTWLNLFPSGKARLGIDDFVGRLLENPEVNFLKDVGEQVKKGEPLFQLNEGGHTLTVRSPIEGTVVGLNGALLSNPKLIHERLFSDGWVYTIRPKRAADLRTMLLGEETKAWMQEEFARLRDVFAGVNGDGGLVPATLQDGGPPFTGSMKHQSDMTWKRFEDEFLRVD